MLLIVREASRAQKMEQTLSSDWQTRIGPSGPTFFHDKELKPNLGFIANPLLITFSQSKSLGVIIPWYIHE